MSDDERRAIARDVAKTLAEMDVMNRQSPVSKAQIANLASVLQEVSATQKEQTRTMTEITAANISITETLRIVRKDQEKLAARAEMDSGKRHSLEANLRREITAEAEKRAEAIESVRITQTKTTTILSAIGTAFGTVSGWLMAKLFGGA